MNLRHTRLPPFSTHLQSVSGRLSRSATGSLLSKTVFRIICFSPRFLLGQRVNRTTQLDGGLAGKLLLLCQHNRELILLTNTALVIVAVHRWDIVRVG